MAKILWLQDIWIEFYGLMSISAYLKKHGHQSEVLFGTDEEIIQQIEKWQPDLIAFSCMSVQAKWANQTSGCIKARGIKTPIIMGGIHTSMYPAESVSQSNIDIVCLNEGEEAMLELANALDAGTDYSGIQNLWVKKNGEVIRNPTRTKMKQEEMDALPWADREIYKKYKHFRDYPFEIFVGSRGCPFKCSFCEVPTLNNMYGNGTKSTYYRDPVGFVDELDDMKKKGMLNDKLVMFTDSTFNSNKRWFLQFLEEYKKRIDVPFSCNLRLDLVDEAQIKALAESGCDNVRFGLESGDEEIRNRILEKHLKDEQILKAAELLHKYKIPFGTFNLFASPGESYEDAWKTIRMNQKVRPAAIGAYVFLLFPKLGATNYALEHKLIDPEDLDKLDTYPYNLEISLLALHPDRNRDAMKICNLQKFAILVTRLPFTEPLVRLLVRMKPKKWFGKVYSVSQVWEWRKWSSKTTFRRLMYEAILNYQALGEVHSGARSLLSKLSSLVISRKKKDLVRQHNFQASDKGPKSSFHGFRERALPLQ